MNQLIQPNLSVVGQPDYCLAYVEQVFGVKNDPDPYAWQGWLDTQFKHTDPLPANSVPVWFSWTGTIDGVTRNWGHVAVSTPSGVYTNPLSGSGHKVFPSVQALATAYEVQYVGWSEDVGNVRVVSNQGEMIMVDENMLNNLYKAVFDRAPDHPGADGYIGQPADVVLQELLDSPEYAQRQTTLANTAALAAEVPQLQTKITELTSTTGTADTTVTVTSTPVEPAAQPSGKGSGLLAWLIKVFIGKE
jgi:hypothetical protein